MSEPQYMVLLSEIIKKDDKVLSKQMRKLKHETLEEIKNNDYQFEDVIIDEMYNGGYRVIRLKDSH